MTKPYPMFAELDADWQRLCRSRAAAQALRRWAEEDGSFADVERLDAIGHWGDDRELGERRLRALVRWARWDRVAARAVLQLILPGLVRVAAACGDRDPDTGAHLAAFAWQRIRDYPLNRQGSVAANIVLDARKTLLRERKLLDPVADRTLLAPSAEDEAISTLVIGEVNRAERLGHITSGMAEVIIQTRVGGHTIVELAAQRGLSSHGLLQRRLRAEHRLRDYLAA
jgi:hypothetical protein